MSIQGRYDAFFVGPVTIHLANHELQFTGVRKYRISIRILLDVAIYMAVYLSTAILARRLNLSSLGSNLLGLIRLAALILIARNEPERILHKHPVTTVLLPLRSLRDVHLSPRRTNLHITTDTQLPLPSGRFVVTPRGAHLLKDLYDSLGASANHQP